MACHSLHIKRSCIINQCRDTLAPESLFMRSDGFRFVSAHCVRVLLTAIVLSGSCIVSLGTSMAQIKSSIITGLVTDKTGAVIPDAQVTVTNDETQVVDKGKTDRAGEYSVPYLAA